MDRLAVGLNEARKAIGVGKNNMLKLLQSGEIRGCRLGKKWIIPITALSEWLEKQQEQMPTVKNKAPRLRPAAERMKHDF